MSQAVVQSLESIIVDLPIIRSRKLVIYTMDRQTLVILHLCCSSGIEGPGEATTIGDPVYGSESSGSIKGNLDAYFTPSLLGQSTGNVNTAMQRLDWHIRGNTFARSAVETILLDAHGKRLGLAVSELLDDRLYDSLEIAQTLASGDTGRDIEEAERILDLRRHRHFKPKIGTDEVDTDVAHAITIRRTLGERASVRMDVNRAWDKGVAQRACATLGDNGIALIGQPIARHNRIGLVRLSSRGGTPAMVDEAIESVGSAFHLAHEGAVPVSALEIAKNGGPRVVLRSTTVAEAAGIDLYSGIMLEGGAGALAAAHASITLDRLVWHSRLFGPLLLTEDIPLESPRYRDFHLHMSRTPGLGLALDEERLARFHRR